MAHQSIHQSFLRIRWALFSQFDYSPAAQPFHPQNRLNDLSALADLVAPLSAL